MSARVIDPLELYASAMDTSDYVPAVAPVVRRLVPEIGRLLDVGAGGGQIGDALGNGFTAIEPNPTMCRRLAALSPAPEILPCGWKDASLADNTFDTVLAATMPAYFDEPFAFLARCRAWARRTVVWIVPAQQGPKGMCFAGCLPRQWHGEDETPGIDLVLRALPPELHPRQMETVEWTFTGVVKDIEVLANWMADRLGWAADERRSRLVQHLAAQARRSSAGHRLEIPRKSAVCVWGKR
jgi:hypothetical protein